DVMGLRQIGQLRQDLMTGTGGTRGDALRMLGIDPTKFAAISSFSTQLGMVGDALRNVESASARAAIGQEIFGRSWQTLQPQLRQGSEGIRRAEALARELGVAVGGDDGLSNAMRELHMTQQLAADGLRNQFASAVTQARFG